MEINNSLNKISEIVNKRDVKLREGALCASWNKVFSMIMSSPGATSIISKNDGHDFCNKLMDLSVQDRYQAVLDTYGQICLDKVSPLLDQVASIENAC